jgi:hypothetical protein
MSMDTNAQRQEANAHTALRRLQRQAKDKRTKDLAQQGRTEASKLSNQMWILTWSLPQVILSCPEAAGCATSDNSISINSYNDTSRALRDLTQQALRELQRVLGGQLRPEDKKVGVAADRLYEEALGFSGAVPRFQTTCN